MNPRLDDWLEEQSGSRLKNKRRTLQFLLKAYKQCVPDFTNKPRTDITTGDGGFSFHIGTPLPDLRQLSSWMLTTVPKRRLLAKMIPALWKRHGREDLSMAGLLLANLPREDLGEDPWMAFIHLLQRREALMVVLEVAEEITRAGHPAPSDEWLMAAAEQSQHWHQYCVLFLSLRKNSIGACDNLVRTAPAGGEMYERIRSRILQAEDSLRAEASDSHDGTTSPS